MWLIEFPTRQHLTSPPGIPNGLVGLHLAAARPNRGVGFETVRRSPAYVWEGFQNSVADTSVCAARGPEGTPGALGRGCQSPSHFTPDIIRTVGLMSTTMATAAAMANPASMVNRVGMVMDP